MKRWKYAVVALFLLLATMVPQARAQSTTSTPIQHVIIVMQENHSFDNYFGTYPTANGTLVNSITSQLPTVNGIPNGVCQPFNNSCVGLSLTKSSSPKNPVEGQLTYEKDYFEDGGDGFANDSGVQSMVYFDYHTIPAYWDYAEEYGLADNYFAAVLTQTNANRLMLLAGDTPISADQSPPPYLPYNQTVMSQLDGAGVSWSYFDWLKANGGYSNIGALNYISGLSSHEADVQDIPNLYKDLATGSGLPSVSFVSSLGNGTYNEHPPANPAEGEQWVVSLVNDVMKSAYWNTTSIFITWDEGGGFYDNVTPPMEYTIDHNFTSPLLGLGERVPLLVISPYSKESYVSNTLMSQLSLLHFIEFNWNLPALDALVNSANLPLDFFNFSQTPRAPLVLAKSGSDSYLTYPIPLQVNSQNGTQPPSNPFVANPVLVYETAILVGVMVVLVLSVSRVRLRRRMKNTSETVATARTAATPR